MKKIHDVLIVGGGTAGISVAARLLNQPNPPEVTLVEPATVHYYQPLWTLVGAGIVAKEDSARKMADVIPPGTEWIRERVESFSPETHELTLGNGSVLGYRYLVVAPGIQLNWAQVKGLPEALGKEGVCSNYDYEQAPYTWKVIEGLREGSAVFTFPSNPIKCAGAPQKIMYLAEEAFRRQGVRTQIGVTYAAASPGIFGIAKYAAALNKIVEKRSIETAFNRNLVEVRAKSRQAIFQNTTDGTETVLDYSMLHVTPPQSAPSFIRKSPLSSKTGWVDVHRNSLQHNCFPDVFSLGDASSLPCSKTGAAVRKQAPVLVANLMSHRQGKIATASYDGYASCPLVTGYGKVILAEFGYDGKVMETFPFDQTQERFSMFALKAFGLPELYWHGMLKGRL